MELTSVRQVSLDCGISRRMLCYYEEIGLIKSSRKNDSVYRIYDEDAIKRLRQIIVLRKLQIPVKQIKDILNNQNAVKIIEIFNQNIGELDERITALSTVRSILARFVDELKEKADIHLKLDLSNDKSMLAVVSALPFSENKIKENVSMDELNRASEHLRKQAEKSVRVVYRPPATMVEIKGDFGDMPQDDGNHGNFMELAKKFIEETDLFQIKADMRVFVVRDSNDWHNDNIDQDRAWITIPDDMEVPPPYKKFQYSGGLYATAANPNVSLWGWVEDSENYEWDDLYSKRSYGWECYNPFNIYGLPDYDSENDWDCSYVTELLPVKKVKKLSDDEKKRIHSELDGVIPRGERVEIDLVSMILEKRDDGEICELNYPNGLLELKYDGHQGIRMKTAQQFNAPIKIDLRVKTENLFFGFGEQTMQIYVHLYGMEIKAFDATNGGNRFHSAKKSGEMPVGEFMDIEFFLNRENAAIRVNGELWHYSSDYGYIEALKGNPEYSVGAFYVATDGGYTLTVQSLRATEIYPKKGE